MIFDTKGINKPNSSISDFIKFLITADNKNLWLYNGMIVELDPTIDLTNENVLIRWTDISEGFNDKELYHNLADFKKDFVPLND